MPFKSFLLSALFVFIPFVYALDFASTRGPYLVNNATRGAITMNGIWYSLSNSTTDVNAMDPLKDGKACARDAALMSQLKINTIYVMAIDPNANHDECFSIFNSVGIYIMVALRKDGIFEMFYEDFAKSYTTDFLKSMFQTIDAVKDYENLLGFDLGILPTYTGYDDLVNGMMWPDMLKTYRAFVRDTKEYILHNAPRPILVGTNLHLRRNDERLEASELSHSHMYYFTCSIDGKTDDVSRSDYISIYNVGFFETDPVKKQNDSYRSYNSAFQKSTVPVWFSYMGLFDEADYVEYELRPDLLNETFYLYNSSSQLTRPNGMLTGGARVMWTNTNVGGKIPPVKNWGLTTTAADGSVQLTGNFDVYRGIFEQMNTATWLNGNVAQNGPAVPRCDSNADDLKNRTQSQDTNSGRTTITMATDWVLPTRPPGLDALVTSGVKGKRGQMVDVISTSIAYAIKDSKGNAITDLVLKPSSSQTRTTTSTSTGTGGPVASPTGSLSTGAKAGIGIGAGVGGLAVAAVFGFLLLRRRREKRRVDESGEEKVEESDGATRFQKAELATGPGVEKIQAELPLNEKGPLEAPGHDTYAATYQEPVELPVTERPVEVPASKTER